MQTWAIRSEHLDACFALLGILHGTSQLHACMHGINTSGITEIWEPAAERSSANTRSSAALPLASMSYMSLTVPAGLSGLYCAGKTWKPLQR